MDVLIIPFVQIVMWMNENWSESHMDEWKPVVFGWYSTPSLRSSCGWMNISKRMDDIIVSSQRMRCCGCRFCERAWWYVVYNFACNFASFGSLVCCWLQLLAIANSGRCRIGIDVNFSQKEQLLNGAELLGLDTPLNCVCILPNVHEVTQTTGIPTQVQNIESQNLLSDLSHKLQSLLQVRNNKSDWWLRQYCHL